MKKKMTAIALIVALLAVAVIGGTLAYFTDTTDEAQNVFTLGKVDIDLTEPEWKEPKTVVPNQEVPKDPTVTVKDGSEDCWVRVNVTLTNADMFKVEEGADLTAYFKGFKDSDWTLASKSAEGTSLTYAYYYNKIMKQGDTATLFTSVIVPDIKNDENIPSSFNINVIAYAVQAEGFDTAAKAFAAAGI